MSPAIPLLLMASVYGQPDCAHLAAVVDGSIIRQGDMLYHVSDPADAVTDGYFHITLDVRKAVSDMRVPKRIEVTRWKKEPLKGVNVRLYLIYGRHGWAICE